MKAFEIFKTNRLTITQGILLRYGVLPIEKPAKYGWFCVSPNYEWEIGHTVFWTDEGKHE